MDFHSCHSIHSWTTIFQRLFDALRRNPGRNPCPGSRIVYTASCRNDPYPPRQVPRNVLITHPPETRTVIDDVRWQTYVALADDREGSVPRICYDRGLMELMSPRKEHETIKTLIGRLVVAFAEAREVEILSVASTTFRREDLERGFEADESFYFMHAEAMRPKTEIDLSVDPAPELVIEVEITHSAIRKLELFAAMGVQEVWRHNGNDLHVFHLRGDSLDQATESRVLPGFPIRQAADILARRNSHGEIALLKEFRNSLSTDG